MATPDPNRLSPALRIVPVVLLLISLLVTASGCIPGRDDDKGANPGPTIVVAPKSGEPRNFKMGFSTLPTERTEQAYISAFATAAQYADVVLIQRTPAWSDFLPNAPVSKETADTTRLETNLLKQYNGLELFYAIDPTDGVVQRSRVANLPPSIDPEQGFLDPDLRHAFLAYTAHVVKNYKPAYLALGVEINMLFERNPEQFEAFLTLYDEAYDAAKHNNPGIKVFPTFQLEDVLGTFDDPHPPHWELIDRFKGHMDALAISTYPYLSGIRSTRELPENYLSQIKQHWGGEIIIAETANASAPVEGRSLVGTEEDQDAYLTRLLQNAQTLDFSLVVWFAALDPSFANRGTSAVFKDIGLRHSDGSNKLAWTTWENWARRPLR